MDAVMIKPDPMPGIHALAQASFVEAVRWSVQAPMMVPAAQALMQRLKAIGT
jgi:hypothetical protein